MSIKKKNNFLKICFIFNNFLGFIEPFVTLKNSYHNQKTLNIG